MSDSTARKAIELGRTLDRKVIKGHEAEIERLTAELATATGEVERLRKMNDDLLELATDLRGYTAQWDWKYGPYWDGVLEAATKGNGKHDRSHLQRPSTL